MNEYDWLRQRYESENQSKETFKNRNLSLTMTLLIKTQAMKELEALSGQFDEGGSNDVLFVDLGHVPLKKSVSEIRCKSQ